MKNQEIAKILSGIARYLEMESVPFKPYAYEKAAITVESLEEDIGQIYREGGTRALEEIPGVGKGIAERIEEYLKTGKIKDYERMKKRLPINLDEISAVEGMGPRKAKVLYEKLKIKNLKELEKAAKAHKITPLFGFGEKTEKNILEGIEFLKRSKGRFLLGEILPKAKEVYEKLENLKEVEKVDMAGSVRRRKETIGDLDFLVISKSPSKVMDFFVSLPGVVKVWGKGATKASVRLKEGYDMDIRVLSAKQYGAALQYFTGSKEHNIALRKIAIDKGYKLSEYGLFSGSRMIAGATEEEIYHKLGMAWVSPEMREDHGEVEAALNEKLPQLVELKDIKGDLHVHSSWDGGVNSIKELAEAAMAIGYEYIGIADHTKFLRIEHGLNERQLKRRNQEIDKINEGFKNKDLRFKILKGCEANIMADGSIDINNKTLAELDYAIAGIHSQMKMSREQMTQRMIRAMRNPHVDIISHPTGRILKRREEFEIDFEKILKVAKEVGTILEINAYPERLDLNDINIRRAKEAGVKMIINTDAHQKDQLRFMEYGVFQARRGWAEKEDIINCWPAKKMIKMIK
ncbi:MAG: DNA polymerase III [Candidatus Portnoybacteria bacterium CG_4_8_14_3_um_filter_44_10]|uniref:DNA polymerase beta n=3 Tax=Candidatus Portnoyibacteriota TaxID=1817913 RepID=A0A2H0WUD8_9BACT|nr:MAG: DNA polymerase III [Candidatus Portnoybacteria bacterium CG09_land_8_20_14_0_10_44_13]PIW75517.1 MAG: DNA polymerase III [Candidatus Portnoybacteria bacterium CG_4_8_14_3_um_filter_44_10]PIZ68742.1 MAG: DNA polymerase III [Candidatus Portnoybacteria bacterium CG_4_10_14_0_2_um_filter_44_20]